MLHIFVQSKVVRVASALRRYFQMHGIVLAPLVPPVGTEPAGTEPVGAEQPGAATIPEAHTLELVIREARRHPWLSVSLDPPEAFEEDLAAFLSMELNCDVAALVGLDDTFGVRRWSLGRVVDRLNRVEGALVDDSGGEWLDAARQSGEVSAVLRGLGVGHASFGASPEAPQSGGRAVTLRGVARAGRGPEIEVDPLLACPDCDGPMMARQSRHGTFFGCVRYPECRGLLTEEQAEEFRRSHSRSDS